MPNLASFFNALSSLFSPSSLAPSTSSRSMLVAINMTHFDLKRTFTKEQQSSLSSSTLLAVQSKLMISKIGDAGFNEPLIGIGSDVENNDGLDDQDCRNPNIS